MKNISFLLIGSILAISCTQPANRAALADKDPLPSWNEGLAKQQIIQFVRETTDPVSNDYIAENDRIVVFDNDGTLWSEKPLYFQFIFAMDRIRDMAADHPEWKTTQPFQAVLEDDMATVKDSGVEGLLTLTMVSHSGMTTSEFDETVKH